MRLVIPLAILLLGTIASPADASCAPEPGPVTSESCVLREYMAAYGALSEAILDVTEDLQLLASSNPEFKQPEATFLATEQEWFQRVLKSCGDEDARQASGPTGGPALQCMTRRTSERTAAVARYAAELERIRTLPSTKPPIAPVYDCSVSEAQLATISSQDQCVIKAIAPRCNQGDACHVRCLAVGGGKNIGGGCYHLCARSGPRGVPWVPTPEAAACSRAAGK
ncbi:MAG: hypothetical protein ABIP44_05125 [Pseudoxanthomonas sp.]